MRSRQGKRTLEEVGGGTLVTARERPPPCRGEPRRRSHGKLSIGPAELDAISVGLFEVVADDLLVLGESVADTLLDPDGQALVQRGA